MSSVSESLIAVYSAELQRPSEQLPEADRGSFWNFGYWEPDTPGMARASEQLLQHLLGKVVSPAGRALDVAFGSGESTRRLCELFGAANVVGINVAQDQLEAARGRGVQCQLLLMDAAQMQFAPDTFDLVLCIEAAFHFRSRAEFLRRAHTVLKPGGRLIMSDLLLRSGHGLDPQIFPPENEVHAPEEYRAVFTAAGFISPCVDIERSTERQLVPYMAHLASRMQILPSPPQVPETRVSAQAMWRVWFMVTRLLNVADCVIVSAEKN